MAVTDRTGRPLRAPGLASWLAAVAPRAARGEVAIALVSDQYMRTLNRTYRRKDTPTDVLSFPTGTSSPAHSVHLGDLVIAQGVARRQARAAGHSYAAELKVLSLHGLLHLLGYDHDHPGDRGRMAKLERRLRVKGGLREGLVERANRRRERAQRREPRDRSAPAKRRARARVGESEGRSPSSNK